MPRFLHNLRVAVASLHEQWRRAVLSAVGITVGAVAIVLLVSIARGVQADVTSQVRDIGVDVLIVIPGRIGEGDFNPNLVGQSFLEEQDAHALAKAPGVVRSAPWSFVGGGIRTGPRTASSVLVATTSDWFRMHRLDLRAGRLFDGSLENSAVCVLGSIAKAQLFPNGEAVGKEVLINARRFRVIGVTQDRRSEQSLFSMGSLQNLVYIPYHYLKQVSPTTQTDRIMVQIRPEVEPRQLVRELEATLGKRLDRQQFQVLTSQDLLGLVYKVLGILTWLLTGLTSIALFVGGIGIMAIMLMSVGERRREIGIRKAVGARSSDIFAQFLGEAATLGAIGGLSGLMISAIVCVALEKWTPIRPMITGNTVILTFAVCVGTASVFGLAPALRAAHQDPVAALRDE